VKVEHVGVFFDRDGTINTEVDFLRKPEELVLIPKAAQAIREANQLGVKVFVITNQSGIARGFLTEKDLSAIHTQLHQQILRDAGAKIDAIYYCPHHPEFGKPPYNVDCTCRKPGIGMLTKAADEFHIDLHRSFLVGDRFADIKAGKSAGCTTYLVQTGYGIAEQEECVSSGLTDHVVADAYEGWKHIEGQLARSN
jgi:D-glycero-D-manno-heptose 1,7-bisphosphate phosphatase